MSRPVPVVSTLEVASLANGDSTCPECPVCGSANRVLVRTPQQVADALLINCRTVYRWIDQGVLAAIPKGKRGYVIPETEVQRLLQEAVAKAARRRAELGVA